LSSDYRILGAMCNLLDWFFHFIEQGRLYHVEYGEAIQNRRLV